MKDRFAELLAKNREHDLTSSETEELARFLNSPILDPLEDPPRGFVSKFTFTRSDLERRLRVVDWFSHCGDPMSIDLSMAVEQVR